MPRERPECPHRCAICGQLLLYLGIVARAEPQVEAAGRLLYHCPEHGGQVAIYDPDTGCWLPQPK